MAESNVTDDYYKVGPKAMSMITSKDALNHIAVYEKTVILIGIVQDVELKKCSSNLTLLKFCIMNNEGCKVQVLIWGESLINKVKNEIIMDNIILINGGFAKPKKDSSLSQSSISYDISIMSNTVVKVLHSLKYQFVSPVSTAIAVNIENCLKYDDTIEIVAWIKNVISEIALPQSKINQGCLSDCNFYKLEIRMPDCCDMKEFQIGCHVRVKGVMKIGQGDVPYLWMATKNMLTKESDDVKSIKELLKGKRNPKRPSSNDNEDFLVKKFKI